MNKKSIFTVATTALLFGFSCNPTNAAPVHIIQGKYSGQFKIEGLTPNFNSDFARALIGKTIDPESKLFLTLKKLDYEYNEYSQQVGILSEQLFESAMQKDEEERWRYVDCVNFNYDKYISQEPEKPKLDALWKKVYTIENEMKKMIISNFNL